MKKWIINKLLMWFDLASPTIFWSYGIDSNGKKITIQHQVEQEKKIANKMYKEIQDNRREVNEAN